MILILTTYVRSLRLFDRVHISSIYIKHKHKNTKCVPSISVVFSHLISVLYTSSSEQCISQHVHLVHYKPFVVLAIFDNINWRDVQTKNVANNVDMSCLRAKGQTIGYTLIVGEKRESSPRQC